MAATLADPELGDRRQDPRQQALLRLVRTVERPGQAQRKRTRGLAFQRQVGEYIAHQWLRIERLAKRMPLAGVVQCDSQRLAHQAAGAQSAIEPGQGAHLQNLRDATPLLADQPGGRALEFDLGAGVGLVAKFVLQALDMHRIAAAVRQDARQKQARQAAAGLGQDQERVAHGCGHEPFVPDHTVAAAPVVRPVRRRVCGVGPHIGAALLFGHAHAHGQARLVAPGQQARVVGAAGQAG